MKFLLHHFLTCFFIVLIQLSLLQGPSYFWYYSAKERKERVKEQEKERERMSEREGKRERERA